MNAFMLKNTYSTVVPHPPGFRLGIRLGVGVMLGLAAPSALAAPGDYTFDVQVSDGADTATRSVDVHVDGILGNPGNEADSAARNNFGHAAVGNFECPHQN